jgi:hypothetical protein
MRTARTCIPGLPEFRSTRHFVARGLYNDTYLPCNAPFPSCIIPCPFSFRSWRLAFSFWCPGVRGCSLFFCLLRYLEYLVLSSNLLLAFRWCIANLLLALLRCIANLHPAHALLQYHRQRINLLVIHCFLSTLRFAFTLVISSFCICTENRSNSLEIRTVPYSVARKRSYRSFAGKTETCLSPLN